MSRLQLRQRLGAHFMLVAFLIATLASFLSVVITPATASADNNVPGNWVAEGSTKCLDPKSKDFVTAQMIYTDTQVNGGNPVTFNCWHISAPGPSGNQQMLLVATVGGNQCLITVGETPTGDYRTNKDALFQNFCDGVNGNFLTFNSYQDAAGNGSTVGGSADWTAENPGQLTANTITVNGYSESGEVFTQATVNGNVMTLNGTKNADTGCTGANQLDTITVGDTGNSYLNVTTGTAIVVQMAPGAGGSHSCQAFSASITLDSSYQQACTGAGVTCDPTGGNTTGNNNCNDGCPIDCGAGFRWLTCWIFDTVDSAVSALTTALIDLLDVPVNQDFSPAFQKVFDSFRNFGIALLVIAGLVMVIAQAADLEIFSAHTVRKALPRIVIAAIGIALAWPLMQFIIVIFNDIGFWIGQVILGAAGVTTPGGANPLTGVAGSFVSTGLTITVLAVLLFTIGLGGVLSLLLSIGLLLLAGFIVLTIRQIIVLLCILTAPLAIAAYILPGTERIWKFWKDALVTSLVMYPIIMAFLSAGAAMSYITGKIPNNWFYSLLAILMYYAPYAMLPFAFKIAGGLVSTVVAAADGIRHKSIESRLQGYRQNKGAENWKNFKQGNRFQGNNRLTGLLNKPGGELGAFLGSNNKLGYFRSGVRKSARELNRNMAAADYAKRPETAASMFNDPMLQAQTYSSAAEARARMGRDFGAKADIVEQAIRDAQVNGGFGGSRARYAAQQLGATGTGYANMEQMLRTVSRVTGGNSSEISSMVGSMRPAAERSGRNDLKAGFGTMTGLTRAIAANGGEVNGAIRTQLDDAVVEAGRSIDNATLLRNKTSSVTNISASLSRSLKRYQDYVDGVEPLPPEMIKAAGGQAEADRQAREMVGAISAKIQNMRVAGTYGYGPELNVEASSNVTLGQPVKQPGQATAGTVVPPGQVARDIGVAKTQAGVQPRDMTVPPDYTNPAVNPEEDVARGYYEQLQNRGIDRNGPNFPNPEG